MTNKSTNTSIIVKDNRLIEFRGRLSSYENKIMNWCAVKIAREDEDFEYCQLSRIEACMILSSEKDQVEGKVNLSINQIKDIIGGLYKHTIEIKNPNSLEYQRFSLIRRDSYDPKTDTFYMRISEDLKPYLLQLKSNFTKLNFVDMMRFKYAHTQRFYEMSMKELYGSNIANFTKTIKEIKELLFISEKYKRFTDFEKYVLKPTQTDLAKIEMIFTWNADKYIINEKVKGFSVIRKAKSYQRLNFFIRVKTKKLLQTL